MTDLGMREKYFARSLRKAMETTFVTGYECFQPNENDLCKWEESIQLAKCFSLLHGMVLLYTRVLLEIAVYVMARNLHHIAYMVQSTMESILYDLT